MQLEISGFMFDMSPHMHTEHLELLRALSATFRDVACSQDVCRITTRQARRIVEQLDSALRPGIARRALLSRAYDSHLHNARNEPNAFAEWGVARNDPAYRETYERHILRDIRAIREFLRAHDGFTVFRGTRKTR